MSDDELESEVFRRVEFGRREFVRKLVIGAAFVVPAIASFDMASLTVASASALTPNGTKRPTNLVATPAVVATGPPPIVELYDLMATLTIASCGEPVVGAKIVFSAGGHHLGSAVTDSSGTASLSVLNNVAERVDVIEAGGYQVHFAGTATLGMSSASAGLVGP